ncbi:MAG TPA: hydrogenase expression/formation protein HypE, partial [Bacteroidetes bacterium]|nr:hydrogenase expression/formation protein HypE [Bacteroidota bacterium]
MVVRLLRDDARKFSLSCPAPISKYQHILMAHGGGGKLMRDLIEGLIVPAFRNPILDQMHDSAVLEFAGKRLAFTTDSFVVHPLFFPGGDIGMLAVNGTINDLAMSGARPLYLSVGLILEEGLPLETLQRVIQSMQQTAEMADVQLVTGDTKVVDRGKGDGLYINTAGIGILDHNQHIEPASIRPGDVILLNGDVGRHGIAVMAKREGLAFEMTIESDCASLAGLVMDLIPSGIEIHCLRDLTRGGLAGALVEIAETGKVNLQIEEQAIPVKEEIQG